MLCIDWSLSHFLAHNIQPTTYNINTINTWECLYQLLIIFDVMFDNIWELMTNTRMLEQPFSASHFTNMVRTQGGKMVAFVKDIIDTIFLQIFILRQTWVYKRVFCHPIGNFRLNSEISLRRLGRQLLKKKLTSLFDSGSEQSYTVV